MEWLLSLCIWYLLLSLCQCIIFPHSIFVEKLYSSFCSLLDVLIPHTFLGTSSNERLHDEVLPQLPLLNSAAAPVMIAFVFLWSLFSSHEGPCTALSSGSVAKSMTLLHFSLYLSLPPFILLLNPPFPPSLIFPFSTYSGHKHKNQDHGGPQEES